MWQEAEILSSSLPDAIELEKVREAIRTLRVVRLFHKEGICEVEPHLLGVDWDHQVVLLGWLLHNGKNESPGWREFKLSDISLIQFSNESFFRARAGYDRASTHKYRAIMAQLV